MKQRLQLCDVVSGRRNIKPVVQQTLIDVLETYT